MHVALFVLFWLIIFGLMVYLFDRWYETNVGGIQRTEVNQFQKKVTIKLDISNYYRADGTINNIPVNFIVDTGANSVAIPESVAKQAGLKPMFKMDIQTANGIAPGQLTRVSKLTLGPIELYNVKALIMKDHAKYILLGMSALKNLELIQKNNYLVIIQNVQKK